MELFDWPPAIISLESVPPFSPENLYIEQILSDVDNISRTDSEEKLLDHFDVLQQEESEPFDWFSNEKSVDIPLFDVPPSPTFPYKVDKKPPPTAAYPVALGAYDAAATVPAYASYHQQPGQCLVAGPVHVSIPSPPLYSPPPRTPQPSPVAGDGQPAVKLECRDPPTAYAAPVTAEWLKRETLTPPDSPKDEELLKMLENFEPDVLERLMLEPMAGDEFASPAPAAAEELSCGGSPPSLYSDDCGLSRSSGGSSSSAASPYATSDDAEWSPSAARDALQLLARRGCGGSDGARARRRAARPYSKPGVEERRLRKKEQNKNAATRYRLKKKAEVEEIRHEEQQLAERNAELRKRLEEVCREARYLKSLMREVYRKTGLIK